MPKIEIDLPELPEDFEYTGEYRLPLDGEYFSRGRGVVLFNEYSFDKPVLILRKKKWRAKRGELYYFVSSFLTVNQRVQQTKEFSDDLDTDRYDIGNYFKTKEQAQEARDKIAKLLTEINP